MNVGRKYLSAPTPASQMMEGANKTIISTRKPWSRNVGRLQSMAEIIRLLYSYGRLVIEMSVGN